jgi:hypothetical protein
MYFILFKFLLTKKSDKRVAKQPYALKYSGLCAIFFLHVRVGINFSRDLN